MGKRKETLITPNPLAMMSGDVISTVKLPRNPPRAALSEEESLAESLAAVEFGYRQCEKGHNLEVALKEALKVLTNAA